MVLLANTMKEHILVIIFLSFQFIPPSTSISGIGMLNTASNVVGYGNSGLGMISRSRSVNAVSQTLRNEDSAAVRESLAQAVTTLAVLDIGGGALVPVTQHIIDTITTDVAFKATRDAWGVYREGLEGVFKEQFKQLSDSAVKRLLKSKRVAVLRAFEKDVTTIQNIKKYAKTLKHIRRAKKWFRVKSAAKVLGPLFDAVGIGVNSWALSTAIRDCNANPATCNAGAIASATLGIVSGVVGLGVFVATFFVSSAVSAVLGPVGAIVSFTLAICATLIELFYKPPVDEEAIRYMKTMKMIEKLDKYSRLQLHIANRFMANNRITRGDLYVVNQGHLPRWIDRSKSLQFGNSEEENPRKIINFRGECERPVVEENAFLVIKLRPDVIIAHHRKECPILVDGKNIKAPKGEDVGYSFYGFTSDVRTVEKGETHQPNDAYNGSIVLVNSNFVESSKLKEMELEETLRSIYIDTEKKGGKENNYDDIVTLGDLKNLDESAKVTVRTGRGNDVLNIDGFIGESKNQLDADLGPGFNTLSFLGMSEKNSEIRGITYDAEDGTVAMFHNHDYDYVGFVKPVSVLGASPFNLDIVNLFAHNKAENGDDFTVIKFKGKARYEIRINDVAPMSNWRKRRHPFTPHFKIIDTTDNGEDGEDKCQNHYPRLILMGFGFSAVANDVLYNGTHINIYGKGLDEEKRDAEDTVNHYAEVSSPTRCSGEPEDGSHARGGTNGKRLLLTVSFHTKCPGKVETGNIIGGCMMKTKMVSELDSVFFDGDNLFTDFSQNVQSSQPNKPKADVCTLKCPQRRVTQSTTIDLGRGTDYLVMKNDLFLDPCGIDGEDADMILKKNRRGNWKLIFRGKHEKFTGKGKKHQLKGIKWIVNEYGDTIVNLRRVEKDEINLFDEYTRKTVDDIAKQVRREQTDEVADNLMQCLQNQSSQGLASTCKTD